MYGQRKAAARCGRLLLFAALLLGIVTMHTLGHPDGHAPAHASMAMTQTAAPGPMTPAGTAAAPAAHSEHGGMDPMSVCLAVLGAGWTAALLLSLAALGHPAGALFASVRAWCARALWPRPPPRHKALARLSVLRV